MSMLGKLFGAKRTAAREEAIGRGIAVLDVEREGPVFTHTNRFDRLVRGPCTRYSLPRAIAGAPWSFVQRDAVPGAPYPNGWTLASSSLATPSPRLQGVLRTIATEWTEEYLEFEADAFRVHAFWEEHGGARQTAGIAD